MSQYLVAQVLTLALLLSTQALAKSPAKAPGVAAPEVVAQVWSGHRVNFALLSSGTHLYAGYYDANRQLTIAERDLKGGPWTYRTLDSAVGWDSHNYITLAVDRQDRLHVAANMHASPLTFYVSQPGGDVATLSRVTALVDAKSEQRMTYPIFLHAPDGRLIFKYRAGSSGNGNEIYDAYDESSNAWSRLTEAPLTDGEGLRNAYFVGPVIGPDHQFHVAWVWRETPDAATNHDLSYAQSPDLVHWFRADGTPLPLPIRLGSADIADAVPVSGGMINNNTVIGFDDQGRAMITYHKYDSAGDTQIYVARFQDGHWRTTQVSRWTGYRWNFGGKGSLVFEVTVTGAEPAGKGLLRIPVTRLGHSTDILIRADDLSYVSETPAVTLADRLAAQVKVPAGQEANVVSDTGCHCAIVWTARPPNRDQPYPDMTPPSDLMLVSTDR